MCYIIDSKNRGERKAMKTYGITAKNKFGYMMGDLGMQFVFGLIASVLQKYYTDVLQIPIALVMVLFIVARIWDAVNDPMWGTYVDTLPVNPDGRYRVWIKRVSIPLAVATVLMFVRIPGLSTTGYFIYACITYIAFGMIYTGMNVPYGSMASVMTTDDRERSALSTFRSIGSTLGTAPAMVLIMLCYTKVNGVRVMDYTKIILGVSLISILSVLAYTLCFRWTEERVVSAPKKTAEKGATRKAVANILKSGPFWVLSIVAMLFLAGSVFSQSYYTYLADKYFDMPALATLALVCEYLPVAVLMLFVGKLVVRFGRKEICSLGLLIAGVFKVALFFIQTHNPYVFLAFCLLSGIGNAVMLLQSWALVTEVIDYNDVKYGVRDEATSYSLFSFIRKLGHAVSAVFVNASLMSIGYSVNNVTESTLKGMYNSTVLIPGVCFLTGFVLLFFFYPLGKKEVAQLQTDKGELIRLRMETGEET